MPLFYMFILISVHNLVSNMAWMEHFCDMSVFGSGCLKQSKYIKAGNN